MTTKSAAALPAAAHRLAGERDVIEAARRVHRALGDTNRLDLVRRLAQGPATVSELIESTGLSQPLVSWHLRRLRSAGLVTSERSGRESICTLRTETTRRRRVARGLPPDRQPGEGQRGDMDDDRDPRNGSGHRPDSQCGSGLQHRCDLQRFGQR